MQTNAPHVMPEDPDLGCPIWDCQDIADPDAPIPLCTRHLRLAFAYVLGTVEARSAAVVEPLERAPKRQRPENGWVYFVCIDGLIKIGWSSCPEVRFKALRPDAVLHTQPGTMLDERSMHALFAHLLARGREYFRPDPDLLAYIEVLRRSAAA